MKLILKKITALFFLLIMTIGWTATAFAQNDLFTSPLEDIRDRLGQENIDVVEFSKTDWGNLPQEIISLLKASGFENLGEVKQEELMEVDVGGNLVEKSEVNQIQTLESLGLTNEQANLVFSEIRFKGESQINQIIITVVNVLRNLIIGLAIIFIVVAGVRMIFARGDETVIGEQKMAITYSVIGLVAMLLIDRLVAVLYGLPGMEKEITMLDTGFSAEVLGVVSYIKSAVAVLAVLMIVMSGVQMLFARGDEEKIKKQRGAALWIALGIIVIVVNRVIVENIFILPSSGIVTDPNAASEITTGNVANIIAVFSNIIKFGLGFVGFIALGILIYGGVLLVANMGNDEMIDRAKKVIKNAALGIVVILVAFALISTLVDFA